MFWSSKKQEIVFQMFGIKISFPTMGCQVPHPPPSVLVIEAQSTEFKEPRNYKEVCVDKRQVLAMEEEICALKDDCMWKLVYPPKYANIIGSHWIYKVKCKSDGTLE